jgi:cyclase
MFRPRVIPVLLLKGQGLVKSTAFKKHRYIGDPINAVKIFNDLKADELVFLDILATREGRSVSLDFVKKFGEEANMPFAVGGGIKTINQIRDILRAGAEKVVISSFASGSGSFIREASNTFGASTITVCLDVKKNFWGKEQVFIQNGTKSTGVTPVEFAKEMEQQGVGEIIIQSIAKDGVMGGYDIDLIRRVSQSVVIPVVALGGAGCLNDFYYATINGKASALAAGSFFVYSGPRKAVLISYPTRNELIRLFQNENSN